MILLHPGGKYQPEGEPTRRSEILNRNDFIKATMGGKDGSPDLQGRCSPPSVDCYGFLKNRQNHGGTVDSSFACFCSSSDLFLFLLSLKSNSTKKQGNSFFTCRYVVLK